MSVHELILEIREKFGERAGGPDHGIFFPFSSKWLQPKKILEFYDLKSGDIVEYKKKHRPIKVRTLDGALKTVIIDETLPVQQLVALVCEKWGIQNNEEYSFLPEITEEVPKSESKAKRTLTRSPSKQNLADQIGADSKWLNPEKSLSEQKITENDIIVLKKKFFYTDQNVDRNDPVQLNLLYNQSKESILSGKHPCSEAEAISFAALQCQVQFGNSTTEKIPGYIDPLQLLPPEYQKTKNISQEIWLQHISLAGIDQLGAQQRYIQQSRSLKTYGFTFFLVKEKDKKKKLVPVLLGITKQSIVRLDTVTKEILQQWNLTQLKRWSAAANNFTLDFGDYSDSYYVVQTSEGDQISRLISGYIDIIIRKRKEAEKVVTEAEEKVATVEEFVRPGKSANITISGNNVKIDNAAVVTEKAKPVASSARVVSQSWSPVSPSAPQQAIYLSLKNALAMANNALNDLNVALPLPPLGNDAASLEWKKQTIDVNAENTSAYLAVHLSALASLIRHCGGSIAAADTDIISSKSNDLASNLTQINQAIKMLAALVDDDLKKESLNTYAGFLAAATARFIDSIMPVVVGETDSKQELHSNARELSKSAGNLLDCLGSKNVSDKSERELSVLVKNFSKSVGDLVQGAKGISKGLSALKAEVEDEIAFITDLGADIAVITLCVSPCVDSQVCRDQILESLVILRDAMNSLDNTIISSAGESFSTQMASLIEKVEECMSKLIDFTAKISVINVPEFDPLDEQFIVVMESVDHLLDSFGSAEKLVISARDLTLAASQFVNLLKARLNPANPNNNEMVNDTRKFADATSKMVAAAKEVARNPSDPNRQSDLGNAVENLRKAAARIAGSQVRERALFKLSSVCRDVVSAISQLTSTAKAVGIYNRNQASQLALNQALRRMNQTVPLLISAQKNFVSDSKNIISQGKLCQYAKQIMQNSASFASSAKNAAASIIETSAQEQLTSATGHFEDRIVQLEKTSKLVDDLYAQIGVSDALNTIKEIQRDIANTDIPVKMNAETLNNPVQEIVVARNTVARAVEQLATHATSGQDLSGQVTTDVLMALQNLTLASKDYASQNNDEDIRSQIMGAAYHVAESISGLIQVSSESGKEVQVEKVALDAQVALDKVLSTLPGQKDIDVAIEKVIEKCSNISQVPVEIGNDYTASKARKDISKTVSVIGDSVNRLVVASKKNPMQLKNVIVDCQENLENLASSCAKLSKLTDKETEKAVQSSIQVITDSSCQLLRAIKMSTLVPDDMAVENDLIGCSRAISGAMQQLLDTCAVSNQLDSECANAAQALVLLARKLDSINEHDMNNDTFAQCSVKIADISKSILAAITANQSLVKQADYEKSAAKITEIVNFLQEFIQRIARAAYLVGLTGGSVPAQPSPLPRADFNFNYEKVKVEIVNVFKATNAQQVLQTAALIAKHTTKLCSLCKDASTVESVSFASRQKFLALGKEIALKTGAMVNSLKAFSSDINEKSRAACQLEFMTFANSLDTLSSLVLSAEFNGQKAVISPEGLANQKLLTDPARKVLISVEEIVAVCRQIYGSSDDDVTRIELQSKSRTANQLLQNLVKQVYSNAPGQRECQDAVNKLSEISGQTDAALLEATINTLQVQTAKDRTSILASFHAFNSLVGEIQKAAVTNDGMLASAVSNIAELSFEISKDIIADASNLKDPAQQSELLQSAKNVFEACISVVTSAKSSNSNPSNTVLVQKLDDDISFLKTTLASLTDIIQGASSANHTLLIERIDKITNGLGEQLISGLDTYPILAAKLDAGGKQVIEIVSNLLSNFKSLSDEKFEEISTNLADHYSKLSVLSMQCRALASSDLKEKMLSNTQQIGHVLVKFVDAIKLCSSKLDTGSRSKLTQSGRQLCLSITQLVSSVGEGNELQNSCTRAMNSIQESITDLEASIVFAQAGQLNSLEPVNTFESYQEPIMVMSRNLMQQVNSMLTAPLSDVKFTDEIATLISKLKSIIIKAATSISSADRLTQHLLLSTCKNIGESVYALISASLSSAGAGHQSEDMSKLSTVVLGTVSELMRTVQSQSEFKSKSSRLFDAASREIQQAVDILDQTGHFALVYPEQVLELCKELAVSVNFLVTGASLKSEEIILKAQFIQRKFTEMISAARASVEKAPDNIKEKMISTLRESATSVQGLLNGIHLSSAGSRASLIPASRLSLQDNAKAVADTINSIVEIVGLLRPDEYHDLNDPSFTAERDLMNAARNIEKAVKRMAEKTPKVEIPKVEASAKIKQFASEMTFETQIIEATQSIAVATNALILSAGQLQKQEKSSQDNQGWSQGLVSAAKMVSSSVQELCGYCVEAFDSSKQLGLLIVAAKAVSAHTTELICAATVKASSDSEGQAKLKSAAKAIINAADHLVKVAENHLVIENADQVAQDLMSSPTSMKIMEMETQVDILRMEKALENARMKLSAVRKFKYAGAERSGRAEEAAKLISETSKPIEEKIKSFAREDAVQSTNSKRTSYLMLKSPEEFKKKLSQYEKL